MSIKEYLASFISVDGVQTLSIIIPIIIAAATYCGAKKREKKWNTIKEIDVLFALHDEIKDKEKGRDESGKKNDCFMDKIRFLRRLDRFAYGIKNKYYDPKILEDQMSILLVNYYDKELKAIIDKRRKDLGRDNYCEKAEELILSMKQKQLKQESKKQGKA